MKNYTPCLYEYVCKHVLVNVFICICVCVCICRSYLLFVPHGAFPSHHDLASGLGLQLLGCEPPRAQDPAHKIKLQHTNTHTHLTHCICVRMEPYTIHTLEFDKSLFPSTTLQCKITDYFEALLCGSITHQILKLCIANNAKTQKSQHISLRHWLMVAYHTQYKKL